MTVHQLKYKSDGISGTRQIYRLFAPHPNHIPAGVDFETAGALGIKAIWALSLPGKVAPVTAGKVIKNTVYNILSELGV